MRSMSIGSRTAARGFFQRSTEYRRPASSSCHLFGISTAPATTTGSGMMREYRPRARRVEKDAEGAIDPAALRFEEEHDLAAGRRRLRSCEPRRLAGELCERALDLREQPRRR